MNARDLMAGASTIDKSDFLSEAMVRMDKGDTRRLIVTARGELFGVLTLRGIMRVLGSRRKLKEVDSLVVVDGDEIMGIIIPLSVIMKFAPEEPAASSCSHPPTVDISDRLVHARRLMLDGNISRLPVVDHGKLVSMVTERDIAVALYELRGSSVERHLDSRLEKLLVGDIVRFDTVTAGHDASMKQVVGLMEENDIGGVPLVNDTGALMGVVTRRDVIRAIMT